MAKDYTSQIEKLIQERFEIAVNKTTSKDSVVHIAWLAKGIDIWHKSGGKMGHTPEDAMQYIISSVTRLLHKQDIESRLDEIKNSRAGWSKPDHAFIINIDTGQQQDDRITSLEQELEKL